MTPIPGVEEPLHRAILHRYLTGERFDWMMRNSAIWLSQLLQFEDSWEGATPRDTEVRILRHLEESRVDASSVNPTTFPSYHARERHYVNCWVEQDHENAAMWDRYAPEPDGVAIETTYGQLVGEFDDEFWAGRVLYVDYDEFSDDDRNDFNIVMLKRREFSDEREVRIVTRQFVFHQNADARMAAHRFGTKEWLDSMYDQPRGLYHTVSVQRIINRVFAHPKATLGRLHELQQQLSHSGLGCDISASSLARKPSYGRPWYV